MEAMSSVNFYLLLTHSMNVLLRIQTPSTAHKKYVHISQHQSKDIHQYDGGPSRALCLLDRYLSHHPYKAV